MLRWLVIGVSGIVAVLALAFLIVRTPSIPREDLVAKYASDASQFLEVEGGAIAHIRDEGNRNGYPLVLIHGSNASLHTWEPWVAELGDTYRVISLDLPAHGLTGALPGSAYDSYNIDAMASFVDAVVSRLGVTKFAIAGNSMGGRVSWVYTLAHPDKVSHLVLLDASGIPRPEGFEPPFIFKLIGTPVIGDLLTQITPRDLVADGIKSSFTDDTLVTDDMIDRYWELTLMEGSREAHAIRYQAPWDDTRYERLGEIAAPTLILWGEDDELVPVSAAYEFEKRIPNAELIVYKGVGHIPMEEVAEQSAADVRGFLGSL